MSATVVQGDCLDVMPTLDAASVDSIVTDPPYGLSFMGKGWDHAVPGEPFWREALRVAKPGAHLVAFGGTRTYHRLTCAIEDAGWEIRDCLSWLYGSGFPKSHNGPWGGTALKPAWEPIILARKPLAGTVAANVQAHGTGALNIDGCRIEAPEGVSTRPRVDTTHGKSNSLGASWHGGVDESVRFGRWPANVVLDEDAAALLDEQSGERGGGFGVRGRDDGGASITLGNRPTLGQVVGFGDSGGASRFFYTAKASRAERGEGNNHPTVKPLDLMRWLCRLVTPKGGLILDPFCGSGSTGVAALREGFRFTGIELNPEYVAIARARIHADAPLFSDGAA